jgi:hypothetical protein
MRFGPLRLAAAAASAATCVSLGLTGVTTASASGVPGIVKNYHSGLCLWANADINGGKANQQACDATKKGEIWQAYPLSDGNVQLRNGYGQCLFLSSPQDGAAIIATSCSNGTESDREWQLSCGMVGGSCWMLNVLIGQVAKVSGASQSVGAAIVGWRANSLDHSEDWSSSAFG